jgi:5-methylcytosine-specific restriction protein A
VHGKIALLDYEYPPFVPFNKKQHNMIGVLRLQFRDEERTMLAAAAWRAKRRWHPTALRLTINGAESETAVDGRRDGPRTFLLNWNPLKFRWQTRQRQAATIATRGRVATRWSCGRTKRIRVGDQVFLLRVGSEPKGFVAAGVVVKRPYLKPHWDLERNDQTLYVGVRWNSIVVRDVDLLPLSDLTGSSFAGVQWIHQSSGVQIGPEAAKHLNRAWICQLRTIAEEVGDDSPDAGEEPEIDEALEGAAIQRWIWQRQRERRLRDAKIKAAIRAGNILLKCQVPGCNFSFSTTYGTLGRGYAIVHHLDHLGGRNRATKTKLDGLTIVCANCHAMIHKGGGCRTLDQVRPITRA